MRRILTMAAVGLLGLGLIQGCGESCHYCGGRGSVRCLACDGYGRSFGTALRCPVCQGSGGQACPSCGGSGLKEGRRF